MTKKVLTLILALTMVFALAACGESETVDFNKDDFKGEVTSTYKDTDDEPAEDDDDKNEDEPTIGVGKTESGRWENKALDLGFKAPEGWTFRTEEELAQMNGYAVSVLEGSEIGDKLKNATLYYDMMAQNQSGYGIGVVFEKISSPMTISAYIQASITNNEAAFKQVGGTNIKNEATTFKVAGKTFDGIKSSYTLQGTTQYFATLCIPVKTHYAVVTVSTIAKDYTEEILGEFYDL